MEMMTRVVLVAGLPGSGKTHYALECLKDKEGLLIDDIKDIFILKDVLEHNRVVYITDPHFCLGGVREKAERLINSLAKVQVEWVFFENNPDKCKRNVEYRDDGRKVDATLRHLSKHYKPPENALTIWQPGQ